MDPTSHPRVIQHLDSGFTLYYSGLPTLNGGCGHVPARFSPKSQLHTAFVLVGSMQFKVEDLWSFDVAGINIQDDILEDDERALASFNISTGRVSAGRYSVSWQWKTEQPRVAVNSRLCIGRLNSFYATYVRIPNFSIFTTTALCSIWKLTSLNELQMSDQDLSFNTFHINHYGMKRRRNREWSTMQVLVPLADSR
ncbi:unnamed protein product [Toxocara canis]|uniref:Reelin domain-containing protein n=1 Tax=Toxocara canis TaxID=6265 RepID=A0A183V6T2_TOXCA|nr:unnamed protein product [Toxocara canis]